MQSVRRAAVILPLCRDSGIPSVLFTKRANKLNHHSGQVSFPGGMIEEGENPERAATREMWEEIGIRGDDVTVLGSHHDARAMSRSSGNKSTRK